MSLALFRCVAGSRIKRTTTGNRRHALPSDSAPRWLVTADRRRCCPRERTSRRGRARVTRQQHQQYVRVIRPRDVGSHGHQRRVKIIVDAHPVAANITLCRIEPELYVSPCLAYRTASQFYYNSGRDEKQKLTNVVAFVQRWTIKRADLFGDFSSENEERRTEEFTKDK